jgi:protein gp37
MSTSSSIEWTDATWNPVVGCTPVSPGCLNCYAARMARRLEAMGRPEYAPREVARRADDHADCVECGRTGAVEINGADRTCTAARTVRIAEVRGGRAVFTGDVRTVPERLTDPLGWRKPRMVFVDSMSDLFHEAVPFEFVDRVFAVMALCPQHTFQVLTKRPERMAEYLRTFFDSAGTLNEARHAELNNLGNSLTEPPDHDSIASTPWPLPNVWLGTSIESDEYHARAWKLLECPAAVRFLSLEPLIAPVDLDKWELLHKAWIEKRPTMVRYIDWVIVGGESGPGARQCDVAWIRSVVGQCKAAAVPVFVKQLGARPVVATDLDPEHNAPPPGCGWIVEREGKVARGRASLILGDPKGGDPAEWPADLRVRQMPEATR